MASKRTTGAMTPLLSFFRLNRKAQLGVGSAVTVVILISAIMIGGLIIVKLAGSIPEKDIGAQVTNETIQLQTNVFTYQLKYYPIIEGTVRVYNDTATFTAGVDYRIYYDNGTLETLSGGALYNTTLLISVDYKYKGGSTWENFQDVKDTGWSALTMLALAGFVGAAIVILALLMNLIRRGGGGGF